MCHCVNFFFCEERGPQLTRKPEPEDAHYETGSSQIAQKKKKTGATSVS
jgi:hypothetical protein